MHTFTKYLICAILVFSFSLCATFKTSLELRYAAFFPQDSLFRNIYGNVSGDYQLEANVRIKGPYYFWSNFDWFSKKGHSVGLNDPTRINVANGSLGLKYVFCTGKCYEPYVGLGLCVGGVWIKDHFKAADDGSRTTKKAVVGGVAKSGLYYYFTKHIYLDVFADYSYLPVHFQNNVNLGGLKVGLGLGYSY